MTSTSFDWRFVVASVLLFVILAFLPEGPLFSSVFFTVAGIKLFVMSAEALVFFFVLLSYPRFKVSVLSKSTTLILFVWLVWVLMSVVLSDNLIPSLVRYVEVLWHILFVQALFICFREYSALRWLVRNFVVFGFVIYVVLIGNVLLAVDFGPEVQYRRIFLGFHDMRNFGHYALVVLFVVFELMRRAQEKNYMSQEVLYFSIAVIAWICLFIIGGRGPFFAFVASLSVMFLVNGSYFSRRYIGVIVVSMLLGLLASVPLSNEDFGVWRIFHATVSAESINAMSSSRFAIWGDVIRHSLSVPFFGEGPDGYLFTISQESYPTTIQPHGLFLQIVLEWGWPGALIFMLLLGKIIGMVINGIRQKSNIDYVVIGGFGTLMAIVSFSLVDGVLYHPRTTLLFCVMLALLLSDFYESDEVVEREVQRGVLAIVALPLLLIIFLHAMSVNAALHKTISDPNDSSVEYLKFFPSALADPGIVYRVANWSHQWTDDVSFEERSQWYEWAEKNSSRPWLFAYLNAKQLYRAGEKELANEAMSPYRGHMPEYIQDAYECLQYQ